MISTEKLRGEEHLNTRCFQLSQLLRDECSVSQLFLLNDGKQELRALLLLLAVLLRSFPSYSEIMLRYCTMNYSIIFNAKYVTWLCVYKALNMLQSLSTINKAHSLVVDLFHLSCSKFYPFLEATLIKDQVQSFWSIILKTLNSFLNFNFSYT